MKLHFLGAAHTVTGSSFLIETAYEKVLVDCGMFQGAKRLKNLNFEEFLFCPSMVDYVLLTHAHIDHCGLLPKLHRQGFRGTIYATKATCDLASIMLPDSAHIQESDTEFKNRKGQRNGVAPLQPMYTLEDAAAVLEHFASVPYEKEIVVSPSIRAIFRDAGHILGSSILEVFVTENGETTKLVFSGDLGQPNQPIIRDPEIVHGADYLLIESTYGDRTHEAYDKETALAEIINDTMDRGGNLIIPSFAVGRTQTLLYYLHKLWKSGRIEDVPVVVDSPLAIAATRIFLKNSKDFDDEAIEILHKNGTVPKMPHLKICETSAESCALNSSEGSAIILSASGMADAGRVLHHLKHNLWRPESTVLFVGYQAEGSLGRRLVDGIKRVRVMGEEISVAAQIKMLGGFSAHADADQLMAWASHFTDPKPAKIFVVHGDGGAQDVLADRIQEELDIETYIPFRGDFAEINGRESVITPSALPEISMEKDVNEIMRSFDAEYRELRDKLEKLLLRDPQKMDPVIRMWVKGQRYLKKMFDPLNI